MMLAGLCAVILRKALLVMPNSTACNIINIFIVIAYGYGKYQKVLLPTDFVGKAMAGKKNQAVCWCI